MHKFYFNFDKSYFLDKKKTIPSPELKPEKLDINPIEEISKMYFP